MFRPSMVADHRNRKETIHWTICYRHWRRSDPPGSPVHFGLGTETRIDAARIVWPNGVMQAEFDLAADQDIVATLQLKGSCPWLFA